MVHGPLSGNQGLDSLANEMLVRETGPRAHASRVGDRFIAVLVKFSYVAIEYSLSIRYSLIRLGLQHVA